ncbi:hypothetical protein A2U01_0063978, partial [Trifolium medium]|nr:hypothetical protein [Trifolium medium]
MNLMVKIFTFLCSCGNECSFLSWFSDSDCEQKDDMVDLHDE